jgi:hypothetical protein
MLVPLDHKSGAAGVNILQSQSLALGFLFVFLES